MFLCPFINCPPFSLLVRARGRGIKDLSLRVLRSERRDIFFFLRERGLEGETRSEVWGVVGLDKAVIWGGGW